MKSPRHSRFLMVLLAAILPAALVAADGTAGVAEPADIPREARAREIEAKIGREGLTLALFQGSPAESKFLAAPLPPMAGERQR